MLPIVINLAQLLCLKHHFLSNYEYAIENPLRLGKAVVNLYDIMVEKLSVQGYETYIVKLKLKTDDKTYAFQVYIGQDTTPATTLTKEADVIYKTPQFIVEDVTVVASNIWYKSNLCIDQVSATGIWADFALLPNSLKGAMAACYPGKHQPTIAINEIPCNILCLPNDKLIRVGTTIIFYRWIKGNTERYRTVSAVVKPRK